MISLSRQRRIARGGIPSRAVLCWRGVPAWSPQLAAWPLPLQFEFPQALPTTVLPSNRAGYRFVEEAAIQIPCAREQPLIDR